MSAAKHNTPAGIPVTRLKGVGPKGAERLYRLGIYSLQDLLFHLPLRYEDRTRVVPIGALVNGSSAVIEGCINHSEIRFGRRRSLLVHVSDNTGSLVLRFFHFSATQKNSLQKGAILRCFGEVRKTGRQIEMVHPEYRLGTQPAIEDASLTPVYPTTEGMHQLTWRSLTGQCLDWLEAGRLQLEELLPDNPLSDAISLQEALKLLHRPPPDTDLQQLAEGDHPARQRLAFEELVAHQVSLRQMRYRHRQHQAPAIAAEHDLVPALLEKLPFQLTAAQRRSINEIHRDLARLQPMMRLLQGDVGSGKTLVAALAAARVVSAGFQVTLMAPTELLAEQHHRNFSAWFDSFPVNVVLLTGKSRAVQRNAALQAMASGDCQVVIGTHALFQEDVSYARLGLVIIDEQHRFGVHQRLALQEKAAGLRPHQLVMTATPIPRTLAMTAFADLDVSVIDELPPGRTPVKTLLISSDRRAQVMQRVEQACLQGRQAYWVCTLIEDSESLQCQAAEETAASLSSELEKIRVGLVHGRMKPADKQQVMQQFKDADIDLLVATTVIEVGVDVPNASLMIIENPERLGLAQLHQLRGRVGRGSVDSHCLLMYQSPLSEQAQQRLTVMRETSDGFMIAQKDLELRGPGEVLGTRQTGEMQLRIADLLQHQDLLEEAQAMAEIIIREQPACVQPLVERWLGHKTDYANV